MGTQLVSKKPLAIDQSTNQVHMALAAIIEYPVIIWCHIFRYLDKGNSAFWHSHGIWYHTDYPNPLLMCMPSSPWLLSSRFQCRPPEPTWIYPRSRNEHRLARDPQRSAKTPIHLRIWFTEILRQYQPRLSTSHSMRDGLQSRNHLRDRQNK